MSSRPEQQVHGPQIAVPVDRQVRMVAVNQNECKQPDPLAAIVLTGGQSRRMGRPKHLLPFGNELLLQRICRLLADLAAPIVVVSAQEQLLPELDGGVSVVHDEWPGAGPLGGLITGLAAVNRMADSAAEPVWVGSCDAPFIDPAVTRFLQDQLADHDAVIIRHQDRLHPLGAIYRTTAETILRQQFLNGQRRLTAAVSELKIRIVESESLRRFDPELHCLQNLNTFQDYSAAVDRSCRAKETS